jgi:hypothetical protein
VVDEELRNGDSSTIIFYQFIALFLSLFYGAIPLFTITRDTRDLLQ